MLPNGSERIIPSVVGYSTINKNWLVGTPARNQFVLDPDNTARSIKRKMGTDARVSMGGQEFTPQQVSGAGFGCGYLRPCLLYRYSPPGHPRRRTHRRVQRPPHHQRADRGGAGL